MIQETQTKRPKSKTANSQLEFRKHFRLQLFHWHSGIPILCGCLFRNWLRRWIRRCDAVIRSSKDNSSHRSVILVNLISVSDRFKPNLQLQHRFDVIIIEFQNQILNRSTSGIMLVDAPKSIPRKINLTETEFHLFPIVHQSGWPMTCINIGRAESTTFWCPAFLTFKGMFRLGNGAIRSGPCASSGAFCWAAGSGATLGKVINPKTKARSW